MPDLYSTKCAQGHHDLCLKFVHYLFVPRNVEVAKGVTKNADIVTMCKCSCDCHMGELTPVDYGYRARTI